eukprot:Skav226833  [mRNA]  locus=scaffold606:449610:450077:+ [translate_table: standard]
MWRRWFGSEQGTESHGRQGHGLTELEVELREKILQQRQGVSEALPTFAHRHVDFRHIELNRCNWSRLQDVCDNIGMDLQKYSWDQGDRDCSSRVVYEVSDARALVGQIEKLEQDFFNVKLFVMTPKTGTLSEPQVLACLVVHQEVTPPDAAALCR